MNPERRERVKEILEEALEQSPEERGPYLERVCPDDSAVRLEVLSLLEEELGESPWPEAPLWQPKARNGKAPKVLTEGQRVDAYRIRKILGEGGMGIVALAVREDDFTKRVALKVVTGQDLGAEALERFQNERQILARLEHPAITHLLDGGTTPGGLPYLVMELVEGKPLDQYLESTDFDLEERLELFLTVCDAVQHAHRNLVVHRDLKPSNILVTEEGKPKVLDFGIARRLEESARDLTGQGVAPMTLRYASPEQILNEGVTTATDVHGLGLLLYLMLTERHAFGGEGQSDYELAHAIRTVNPALPSTTAPADRQRQLTGDLDSIVAKALRKEPEARYGSVEALVEDLRRFREERPVLARRGSWGYVAGKWVRRTWLPLAAALTLVVLSLVYAVSANRLRVQAEEQRLLVEQEKVRAEKAHDRSIKMVDFFQMVFEQADFKEGEMTALEMVQRGEDLANDWDDEIKDAYVQAELLGTIGRVYMKGGMYDRAKAPLERAVLLAEEEGEVGRTLPKTINNLAGWYFRTGRYKDAERLYRSALHLKEVASQDRLVDLAKANYNLANALAQLGAYEESEGLYENALAMRREEYGEEHLSIARILRALGNLYYTWGKFDLARPLVEEALRQREVLLEPEDTQIASALSSLGRVQQAQGHYDEASASFQRALTLRREEFDADHPHVAASGIDLARLDLDLGRCEEAEERLKASLVVLRQKKELGAWEIAEGESLLGAALVCQGELDQGETLLRSGLERLEKTRGERSIYTIQARDLLEEAMQVIEVELVETTG